MNIYAAAPKVAYINSYHSDYSWSKECFLSFKNNVPKNTDIYTYHLDSKRNPSIESINNMAINILDDIEQLNPDIIVAADDNASKYIIEPYFKNASIPVVFLGVNVDPSKYKYPYKNATGVIESYSSTRFFNLQKLYFRERKPVFIFANTTTGTRKYNKHKEIYGSKYPVDIVGDTQALFNEISNYSNSDTIFIFDNLWGLRDFNETFIKNFIEAENNILIASITDSNKNFSHLIFKQSAREQGGEAGMMVRKILSGTLISDINIKYGVMFGFTVNKPFFTKTNTHLPIGISAMTNSTNF